MVLERRREGFGRRRAREEGEEDHEEACGLSFVESSWIIQLEVRGLILHFILLGFDVCVLDLGVNLIVDFIRVCWLMVRVV